MSDEPPDNVIEFKKKVNPTEDPILKIRLDKESTQDMILVLACINMSSDFAQECRDTFSVDSFPCKDNCICYLHMLSSMGMEVIFGGDKAEEAHEAIMLEYVHMANKISDEANPTDQEDND